MNVYILIPQITGDLFELPIGVYSSRELAFHAIQHDYVERHPTMPIEDIKVSQSGNVEVLTCVNEQGEAVVNYAIILKVLDDVDVESTLIS